MRKRIKFIASAAKGYGLKLAVMLVIILVTTFIVAVFPTLSGQLVDMLFYSRDVAAFWGIIKLYVVLFLVNQLLHFTLQMINTDLRTKFIYDIKCNIFQKVLAYRCDALTDLNTGDIIYRINKDADQVMTLFYSDIFYGISAAFDFVVCFWMLTRASVVLALVTLVLAMISFVVGKYFSEKMKPLQKELAGESARNASWLFELLNSMQEIKILGIARSCVNKYLYKEIELIQTGNEKKKYDVIAERSNQGVQTVCTVGLYAISAVLIAAGHLTIGGMVACMDYFERMTIVLERFSRRFVTLPERLVSVDRIIEIEDAPSEEYHDDAPEIPIARGEITLHNVCFSYDGGQDILKNISLEIPAGEKVAIVGKSGEGKSTIAKLLCRLYDPQEGIITIDGVDIQQFNLKNLRRQIGIAHQDTILFNNSIRYNLIFADSRERDEEIWEALKKAQLFDHVSSLPEGLDSLVGVEGNNFSGGQKQRIALARLFLKKPALVILDETTSALDSETEKEIIESWNEVFAGRTMIMIAHRFSAIKNADKIIFLHQGKVAGYDSHENLLRNCAEYQEWFQSGALRKEEC